MGGRKLFANRETLAKNERNRENLGMMHAWKARLIEDGYVVIPGVFSGSQIDAVLAGLTSAFANDNDGSTLRAADGSVFGARNLLRLWPAVVDACQQAPLPDVLGEQFGLVRVLYFDKPPEQSWALPWHKDMAIAVQNNRLPSNQFGKPTFKVGVPHVEAPEWLLENMLTLRIHLDDITNDNGPLKVLPRSHRTDNFGTPVTVVGSRGDVLLMRPLLSHASNKSNPESKQHRRILHYEFSGNEQLPDGYAWHDFLRGGRALTRTHLADSMPSR